MRGRRNSRLQLRASRPHSLLDARTPRVTRSSLLCGTALGLTLLIFSGLAPTPAAAQQALPPIVNSPTDQTIINNNNCNFAGDCIFISTINGAFIDLTNNGILNASGLGGNGIQLDTEGKDNVGVPGVPGGAGTGGAGSAGSAGAPGPNGGLGGLGGLGGDGSGGPGVDGGSAVGGAAGNITTTNNNVITTFGVNGNGIFETAHGGRGAGGGGGGGGAGTGGDGGAGGAGGAADAVTVVSFSGDATAVGGVGGDGGNGGNGGNGTGGSGGAGGSGT